MKPLLSLVLFVISLNSVAQSHPAITGSICGAVLDERGRPAALVHVVAIYQGAHLGPYPSALTDQRGHYCIPDVQEGEYLMSADDPEKGYPHMARTLYASAPPGPRVRVTEHERNPQADWQIPYKAAILRIRLTDSTTGKPIAAMTFKLDIPSRPESYIHGNSDVTIPLLLPPNEDVRLSVSAPGYSEWPGDGTSGKVLYLGPGAVQELAIALRPLPQ